MTSTTTRGKLLLVLLLFLATTASIVVQAKVSIPPSSNVFSSSSRAAGRYLQDKGNSVITEGEEAVAGAAMEEALSDHSGKDASDTNNNNSNIEKGNGYVPHADGTAVRFQDQDGTWMDGTIDKYDSSTQTYTIRWDEDDVKEDFSNLDKVDRLVVNAEEKVVEDEKKDDEEDENYDWNNDEEESDAPSVREEQKDSSDNKKNNNNNKDDEKSSASQYQGTVPEDFDFGYTYNYDDLTEYEPWPVDALTLLEFADGWYEGKISSFALSEDSTNATYVVTWSDGTADNFVNELEWMDLMVQNAEDYEPWEVGTQTYGYPNPNAVAGPNEDEPENAFLGGEITAFKNGEYTVTWSNSDAVVYNDFDMMDELVNNAGMYYEPNLMENYEPWPVNTPVSWDFDDGWWEGTITGFIDGTYEVGWSDGSIKYYTNLEKIDQMVAYAVGDGFNGDMEGPGHDGGYQGGDYPIGTPVYATFQDDWWVGYIDSYDGDYYVIRWSDDTIDTFLAGPDMDEMVMNGQYIPYDDMYPVGTYVYKDFDGLWYWGTVEYNDNGFYTILWEDGERSEHVSGIELDELVANAYAANSGMRPFGKAVLSIFVLVGFAGIVFFVVRRNNVKKQLSDVTEQVRENELGLTEGNGLVAGEETDNPTETEYSDKPEEGTKPALV